ncbi:hypothetical protein [Methyloprofundus sedimenti]|nr:hypothetical protein [Methyloprofundus sedimenti]
MTIMPVYFGIAFIDLVKAIQRFNPDYTPVFSAPMTAEKVLLALYSKA